MVEATNIPQNALYVGVYAKNDKGESQVYEYLEFLDYVVDLSSVPNIEIDFINETTKESLSDQVLYAVQNRYRKFKDLTFQAGSDEKIEITPGYVYYFKNEGKDSFFKIIAPPRPNVTINIDFINETTKEKIETNMEYCIDYEMISSFKKWKEGSGGKISLDPNPEHTKIFNYRLKATENSFASLEKSFKYRRLRGNQDDRNWGMKLLKFDDGNEYLNYSSDSGISYSSDIPSDIEISLNYAHSPLFSPFISGEDRQISFEFLKDRLNNGNSILPNTVIYYRLKAIEAETLTTEINYSFASEPKTFKLN